MRARLPFLFPRPREVVQRGGFLPLPKKMTLVVEAAPAGWSLLADAAQSFLDRAGVPLVLCEGEGKFSCAGKIVCAKEIPAEGYALTVGMEEVFLRAADACGAFYGVQTLTQLWDAAAGGLVCAEITDAPELAVRGFMLDISRCKVPTLAALEELVSQLAALRINQLQLYTEHTYAFPGHEIVWRDASPMTAEELQKLDQWCRAHGIELVPNLQSFGHMDRWLKHAPYRELAECPEGFFYELINAHRAAGTLRPNQASLDFVGELYDAYLANFSSDQLNIGGDEPWELGKGWSAAQCAVRGKHAVYCEHLNGIHRLVTERGRKMQFWADILLEDPAHAGMAPRDAIPVIWGYDAGHPFPKQCESLKRLGYHYLVAPGASSWQSFHGRLDNALTNVNEAVRAAQAHGAGGILLTAWGDNGNHHPWFVAYPALAAAAGQAWCLAANAGVDLAAAVGRVFLRGDTALAEEILAMGKVDGFFPKQIRNKSVLWSLLCDTEEVVRGLWEEMPRAALGDVVAAADRWLRFSSEKNPVVIEEMRVSCALQLMAVRRAELLLGEGKSETAARRALAEEMAPVLAAYEQVWLRRARPGGLEESVSRLRGEVG